MYKRIAVVGIGAQLPSGKLSDTNLDYKSFFEFLLQRGEAYEPIPEQRFNTQYIHGDSIGNTRAVKGAFLKGIDQFDFIEFGVTAKDARYMSLSTRKLVEVAFLSLYDSGIDYRGKNVGCYMSGVAHDFFSVSGHDDAEAKGSFALVPSMVANRVSYHLDLRGPSIPVDTACSSSMHATHLAVQALRLGECDAAVVGGCQINHRFAEWLYYTQGGVLSPNGKCKPFDISADGFGRGEGAVAIVLKPLDDALRDGDHIYATILGTSVNSCGSVAPISAPVASAQRDAMRRAFSQTERLPSEVDFLELHATGTAQGDPTEANWVGEEFKRDCELRLGSVKGNIGHLEITSFLASMLKVCGILDTGLIPPTANFSHPNPAIRWKEYRFRVPTEVEHLKCRSSSGLPLIAMTSSGIGGANGHCVVEGPPTTSSSSSSSLFWMEGIAAPALLIAGGLSPRSIAGVAESLLDIADEDLTGLARVFGRRARSMTWRVFGVTKPGDTTRFSEPTIIPKKRGPIVFVFSGQGTQYFHMGRELFKSCAPFHDSILELDQVYATAVGSSLIESTGLFIGSASDTADSLGDPWPIAITLPALTMLQLALVDTLSAIGVTPNVVVGHSAGETAMLYASGSGSKAMALELAIARGRAFTLVEEAKGTMAAVSCTPEDARRIIAEVKVELGDGTLVIGCYNTPNAITLSGAESHVDLAVAKASALGIFARKLRTRIPVHSSMMELCSTEFHRLVEDVFARYSVTAPQIETYSTGTGALFSNPFDAQYYWDSTVGPVRFTEAITNLVAKHKHATFVEIGPHPALASYISSMTERNTVVTCPLRRPRGPQVGADIVEFLTALGKLVVTGYNCVDFDALYGSAQFEGKLPAYPFMPKTVPWSIPSAEIVRQQQHRNGPMNYPQLQINIHTHPGLADHIIKGEPIMPAAGFLEMALEFGTDEVYDVEFHSLLPLSSERPVPVEVKLEGTRWTINSAASTDYNKTWPIQYNRRHASGFLSRGPALGPSIPRLDLDSICQRMSLVDMDGFYNRMSFFANFGPMYRRIRSCHIARGPNGSVEVLTEVRAADSDIPNLSDYRLHPAILDAAIHVMVHPMLTSNYDHDFYHLPSRVSMVRFMRPDPLPAVVFGHITLVDWSPELITYNATIADGNGTPICVLERIQVALHGHRMKGLEKRLEVIYRSTGLSLSKCQNTVLVQPKPRPFSTETLHTDIVVDDVATRRNPATPLSASSSTESDANSISTPPSSRGDPSSSTLIFDFVRGEEMKIQAAISNFDPSKSVSLLFVARGGLSGDAAFGFTRALRKEYRTWIIRVATFDASWTDAQRTEAAQRLLALHTNEVEMLIDADGSILVPRVELSNPPSPSVPLSLDKPWRVDRGKVVQTHIPYTAEDHVVVAVSGVTASGNRLWTFVGKSDDYAGPVVGISTAPLCSHLQVHKGSVIEMEDYSAFSAGPGSHPPVLAATIVALAVGSAPFDHKERVCGVRVLIVDIASGLGSDIRDVCAGLGMEATLITSLDDEQLKPYYFTKPHVVLSDVYDAYDVGVLRSILDPRRGRAFFWDHATEGVASVIANDPWIIGDALRSALQYRISRRAGCISYRPPSELVDSTASLPVDLFDPRKNYLLVGGIGSLGLHVAVWMYERGARHIVLTSRSGPATLDKSGDWVSQRLLHYLRGRSDLCLETPAIDATSEHEMSALIRNLSRPLGGCMLLAMLLNDRMFASQTEETFESVFPCKVEAFDVLKRSCDLDSLDFVVTFSSVSGMFGNAGQTNYASANSALAGMTRKHKNAFCIVCPAITDSRFYTAMNDTYLSRLRHITAWGMPARELCDYIGDGIRKLGDGPMWQYIPGFDWHAVRESMGPSSLYNDLVPDEGAERIRHDEDENLSLLHIVCRVLDLKIEDVSADVPLTGYGLDSLSASSLSFAFRPLLAVSQLQLLADLTINDLQERIEGNKHSPDRPSANIADDSDSEQVRRMEELLERFSTDLPSYPSSDATHRDPPQGAVVITGTTGSVGAHLLAQLPQMSDYTEVYAFVRPSKDGASVLQRQLSAFESRGLDASLLTSSRLVVVPCILENPLLGLSKDMYEKIRTSVSHIIHLGWHINLNDSLSSFESTLMGLRSLIDLARDAHEFGPATLMYGSSLGIFRNYLGEGEPKEEPIPASVAVGLGYSESKWIAERLLQIASNKNIVQSVVVRIGQLTGGMNGAWKAAEWLPAMICASAALGCLPSGEGIVSWLPVDTAAAVLAEMAGLDAEKAFTVFHLRHPRPISWTDIMDYFSAVLSIPTVPYSDWLSRLTDTLQTLDAPVAKYVLPALRLLQVYKSAAPVNPSKFQNLVPDSNGIVVLMDIEESSRRCSSLRDPFLPQLDVDDVRKWVEYWRAIGALPQVSV